jgi:hypothetical protein
VKYRNYFMDFRYRARATATTSNSSSDNSKERRLVVMLVTVNCIFIVTAMPNIMLGLARSLVCQDW